MQFHHIFLVQNVHLSGKIMGATLGNVSYVWLRCSTLIWNISICVPLETHECELVVDVHQVLDLVLLQHHKVIEVGPPGAVLTVNHVRLSAVALRGDQQQVEHFHLQGGGRQRGQGSSNKHVGESAYCVYRQRDWIAHNPDYKIQIYIKICIYLYIHNQQTHLYICTH